MLGFMALVKHELKKQGKLPKKWEDSTDSSDIIEVLDDDSVLLKKGVYNSIGPIFDYESGAYEPVSYNIEEDLIFSNSSENRLSISNYERMDISDYTKKATPNSSAQTVTLATDFQNKDSTWSYGGSGMYLHVNSYASFSLNLDLNPSSSSPCYEADSYAQMYCNLSSNASLTATTGLKWTVDYVFSIMKDSKVVEELNSGEFTSRSYYPNVSFRKLEDGEYLRFTLNITIKNMGGSGSLMTPVGESCSFRLRNFYSEMYPEKSVKVGLSYYGGTYHMEEDFENSWDLGYLNFGEGKDNIDSWSPTSK